MRCIVTVPACCWLSAIVAACAALPAVAADAAASARVAEAFATQVCDAANPDELHQVSAELLRGASPELLEKLSMHENTTVSLLAKWATVRRTFPAPFQRGVQWEYVDIDRAALARFLGFLEGRIRTPPPAWWQRRMLRLQSADRDRYAVRVSTDEPPAPDYSGDHPSEEGRYRWRAHAGMSIGPGVAMARNAASTLVLNVDGRDVPLSELVLDDVELRTANRACAVNAIHVSDSRFLVALHHQVCGVVPLYFIDTREGEPLWCAEVWAEQIVTRGGLGFGLGHWVDFKVADGNVYLFGAGLESMYVECFNVRDGKNLFRFSTSY
ncbi:MAG TPA: hypothetical protein VMV69_27450 [Pirellulales bacterium]|nr:hypothetical protein [Pirellulales bacterium]